MAGIKRKSQFNEKVLTPEELESGILRNADGSVSDEIEVDHGNPTDAKFVQPAVGVPTRGQVLEALGQDDGVLTNLDPKALERESTAPCVASAVVMTDEMESKVIAAGMIQTALESPTALNNARISMASRKELSQRLVEASKEMPTPDSVTFVDNRRVIIPAEVRDVPNRLSKKGSMKVLELIVGEPLCLKVMKIARQSGVCFFNKPCLWLAQRLAQELGKRMLWERIDIGNEYEETDDGNNNSEICKAIAGLFSYHVMEQMQVICATRRISMVRCAKILIDRVCDIAIDEKAPKDYVEKYDDIPSLEVAVQRMQAQAI